LLLSYLKDRKKLESSKPGVTVDNVPTPTPPSTREGLGSDVRPVLIPPPWSREGVRGKIGSMPLFYL